MIRLCKRWGWKRSYENVVADGKWAQAHSVPIYRGGDNLVNQEAGGAMLNLDSCILHIQQHRLPMQPKRIELLFGGWEQVVCHIFSTVLYILS